MPKLLSRSTKDGARACLFFLAEYFMNRFRHSIDFIGVHDACGSQKLQDGEKGNNVTECRKFDQCMCISKK